MASDLEKRLRQLAGFVAPKGEIAALLIEAADELAKRDYQMGQAASRIAELNRENAHLAVSDEPLEARIAELERENLRLRGLSPR